MSISKLIQVLKEEFKECYRGNRCQRRDCLTHTSVGERILPLIQDAERMLPFVKEMEAHLGRQQDADFFAHLDSLSNENLTEIINGPARGPIAQAQEQMIEHNDQQLHGNLEEVRDLVLQRFPDGRGNLAALVKHLVWGYDRYMETPPAPAKQTSEIEQEARKLAALLRKHFGNSITVSEMDDTDEELDASFKALGEAIDRVDHPGNPSITWDVSACKDKAAGIASIKRFCSKYPDGSPRE